MERAWRWMRAPAENMSVAMGVARNPAEFNERKTPQ
jgi:hypothetical protein